MPNRLSKETSSYLLSHAHNPVDWYPWGPEAFERARAENKPLLLSVGYSACHWCHVMERESFEDEDTAKLMNEHFVSMKVDREERPDVDQIYQHAVQLLTRQGGWPLTAFLTPDGRPFFAGTYFPPDDRYGRPSFRRVLTRLADVWRSRNADVVESAAQIVAAVERINTIEGRGVLTPVIAVDAARALLSNVDRVHGGFGGAPKFPNATALSFLMGRAARAGDEEALAVVLFALRKMADGGVYDQLGGGFHRYAVDDHWLVPHFEKMLYDNALLFPLYIAAWRRTGDAFFRRVADETAAYLMREMTSQDGGFYATQDADSEGEEGKFFVWRPNEVKALLGEDDAKLVCARFGITAHGNFEHGATVLSIVRGVEDIARELGIDAARVEAALSSGRAKMFAAREPRIRPARDDKVIASWNGLAIRGLATSPDASHVAAAERAADHVMGALWDAQARRLRRTTKHGVAKHAGVLDDYAFLAAGALELFFATGRVRWLDAALDLARAMLERFWSDEDGAFFLTQAGGDLVVRPRSSFDQAIPSGAAIAVATLSTLGDLVADERFVRVAEACARTYAEAIRENPFGFASFAEAIDAHFCGTRFVVVVGRSDAPSFRTLLETARAARRPDTHVVALDVAESVPRALAAIAQGKTPAGDAPAAYVCRRGTCERPVTDPATLRQALGG